MGEVRPNLRISLTLVYYGGQLSLSSINVKVSYFINSLKKLAVPAEALAKAGVPGEIRTRDLRIRSPSLYPTELRAHSCMYSIAKWKMISIIAFLKSNILVYMRT